MSDWVANFALGVISSKVGDSTRHYDDDHNDDPILLAFWASLLLVHLGCPATITAEALEDNALWPRSLVLWLVQSIRVLCIILLSWRSTWLSYLSLVMLIVGFIKYGEKTFAQYLACTENSLDMLIPPLESTREESDHSSSKRSDVSAKYEIFDEERIGMESSISILEMNPRVLLHNFILFYVSHFVEVVLSYDYLRKHQTNFQRLKPSHAFELVEVQLGYGYDVFYTKAFVMYSPWYHIVESITSNLSLGVIICFGAIVTKKHSLSKMDHIITWIFLVGTIALDYLAFSNIALSEWFGGRAIRLLRGALQHFPRLNLDEYGNKIREMLTFFKRKRWSNALAQGNLLTFCLQQHNNNNLFRKFNKPHKLLRETGLDEIDTHLKEYIFHNLVNKLQLPIRGHGSRMYGVHDAIDSQGPKSIEWTKNFELHQSILIWHIATDLCYYGVCDNIQEAHYYGLVADPNINISKKLSDYMLYILVKQRQMLPVGTGLISFRDTCVETMKFVEIETPSDNSMRDACKKLLLVDTDSVEMSQPNSVLVDACKLARTLTNELEREKRWELLAAVWVEILIYAATHCSANHHAQQLRKGGEFLTHVWLLSAHIGVMEQFLVTKAIVHGKNVGIYINDYYYICASLHYFI
ncbi:hypothetical protein SESBI_37799 [Sesbania bispinosa]|nr:hypothetical protein SESBI_37799 [Sesbania bispinosa]